jgi:hypothetical protein
VIVDDFYLNENDGCFKENHQPEINGFSNLENNGTLMSCKQKYAKWSKGL